MMGLGGPAPGILPAYGNSSQGIAGQPPQMQPPVPGAAPPPGALFAPPGPGGAPPPPSGLIGGAPGGAPPPPGGLIGGGSGGGAPPPSGGANPGAALPSVFPTTPGPVSSLPVGQGGGLGGLDGGPGMGGALGSGGPMGGDIQGASGGLPPYMQNPAIMRSAMGPGGPDSGMPPLPGMQPMGGPPGGPDMQRMMMARMLQGR